MLPPADPVPVAPTLDHAVAAVLAQRHGPFGPSPEWPRERPWPTGTVLPCRVFDYPAEPDAEEEPAACPEAPVLCDHWEPARLAVSRSQANPGRPYFGCARRRWSERCDFFRWGDVPHPYPQRPRPEPSPPGGPGPEPALRRLLRLTEEERQDAWRQEQGSDTWHRARRDRLTGTGFGPAAGHDEHSTGPKLLRRQLWGSAESSSAAMSWGKRHEDDGTDRYRRCCLPEGSPAVQQFGIWVSRVMPFVGVSPDGAVPAGGEPDGAVPAYREGWPRTAMRLVEVKCPYKFRETGGGWEEEELPNGWRAAVPPYYFDQVQAQLLELGCTDCDFVVWTPSRLRVTRIPLDPLYCADTLYPLALRWYFGQYLPAAVLRDEGRLAVGTVPEPGAVTEDDRCRGAEASSPKRARPPA